MHGLINSVLIYMEHHASLVWLFVFFIAFFESLAFFGLFFPGTVFIMTAGFIAASGHLKITPILIMAAAGSIIADIISYHLGHRYGSELLKKKFFHRFTGYLEKASVFFEKHGGKSIVIGRFIGFTRPLIPFLVGSMNMKPLRFYILCLIAGISWSIGYIGSGYVFGESFKLFEVWIGRLALILLFVALIILSIRYLLMLFLDEIHNQIVYMDKRIVIIKDEILSNNFYKEIKRKFPFTIRFLESRFVKTEASGLLLTIGFLITGIFAFLLMFSIRTLADNGTSFDQTLFYTLQGYHIRVLDDISLFFTSLCDKLPLLIFAASVVCVLLIYKRIIEAGFFTFNLAGGFVLVHLLKLFFPRHAPQGFFPLLETYTTSLPSEQVFMSITVFGFALYLYSFFSRRIHVKATLQILFAGIVLLVSLSRIYLGAVWFTDVVATFLAAFVWLSCMITAYEYIVMRYSIGKSIPRYNKPVRAMLSLVVLASLAGCITYSVYQADILNDRLVEMPVEHDYVNGGIDDVMKGEGFYTHTLTGKPAVPVQLVYTGNIGKLAGALKKLGFEESATVSWSRFVNIIKVFMSSDESKMPVAYYFYNDNPQDISYIKTPKGKSFPRLVLRLWDTHLKTGNDIIYVGTIDREKSIRQIFNYINVPLPVNDRNIVEARKALISLLGNLPFEYKIEQEGRPFSGRNGIFGRYSWDGRAVFIKEIK